jgi:hypothetical protein
MRGKEQSIVLYALETVDGGLNRYDAQSRLVL